MAKLTTDINIDQEYWRRAGEVYSHLLVESEDLLHGTDHIEEINTSIILFCKMIFTSTAVAGRVIGDRTSFCETVELVATCMTMVFGQISASTLSSWKLSDIGEDLPGVDTDLQL